MAAHRTSLAVQLHQETDRCRIFLRGIICKGLRKVILQELFVSPFSFRRQIEGGHQTFHGETEKERQPFLSQCIGEPAVILRELKPAVYKTVPVQQAAAVHVGDNDASGGVFHPFLVIFRKEQPGHAALASIFYQQLHWNLHEHIPQMGGPVFPGFYDDFSDLPASCEGAGSKIRKTAAEAEFLQFRTVVQGIPPCAADALRQIRASP